MLLRVEQLKRIKAGEISLIFRRWRKPTVKTGGSLKTAVGLLTIVTVERFALTKIRATDARKAGYPSLQTLLDELKERDGDVYRIEIRHGGEDPRIALRSDDSLNSAELEKVANRLTRMDRTSSSGQWTQTVLELIERHPKTRAADLAKLVDAENDRLKINVRKLKNLGLTVSHDVGYELSPRGRKLLAFLSGQHRD